MQLRNMVDGYGVITILFHWLMVPLIVGLFLLGIWMVQLNYYHPWYNRAPDLHRSLGVVAGILMAGRLLWRWLNPVPGALGRSWERTLALIVHRLFYLLVLALVASGYLISTAEGQGVLVFGWFEVPSSYTGMEHQADRMGELHMWLGWTLMALVLLHASAALKHHWWNRDATLRRICSANEKKC